MRRIAALLPVLLAACQQASPPADNATANADEVVIAETDTPAAEGETPAAQAGAPQAESIPAKFRGIWAEGRAACAQLSHPSRLIISERVIRYPSFVLIGEGVDLPADASFAVKGHNQRTEAPVEAHYSIDATGLILTDEAGGGTVRVKCG